MKSRKKISNRTTEPNLRLRPQYPPTKFQTIPRHHHAVAPATKKGGDTLQSSLITSAHLFINQAELKFVKATVNPVHSLTIHT